MDNRFRSKPENGTRKKTWEDLDNSLQRAFETDIYKENRVLAVDIDEYDVDKDEVIREAEKSGYTVQEHSGNILVFR